MSYRHKPTEFEIQQNILLGAQISDIHGEFKEWAMMDPDMAFMLWFLKNPNATVIEMIEARAKLKFLKSTTEVTKLSMIVGSAEDIADLGKEAKSDNPT